MILLQASHIAKQYDGHQVLTDATVAVQTGDRVALVGVNGAGKSTLLRIVVGEERADQGEVSVAKSTTIGYVSQFVKAEGDMSVYEFVAQSFQDVFEMEKRLRQLELRMANQDVYSDERRFHDVSEAYDRLQQEFEEKGGYAVEAQIRRVLDGLRFPRDTHGWQVNRLSGGQKTRLSLARLLAWQPTVLALDEPTNYLDTETLSWLEDYLQHYAGSLLVISHDRYFLDRLATVVYELEDGATVRYVGNYTDYLDTKAARMEQDLKRFEAQQKEIHRLEDFVQKNIVRASTTKRAQSRRKLLEKMQRVDLPKTSVPKLALQFQCARLSGKDVLEVKNLSLGYGGRKVTGPLDLYVAKGQRIAIIGPNGAGKTTFLKSLMGRLAPLAGHIRWGAHTEIGYYDQEQKELDLTKTVLEQIHDEYPGLDMTTVRTALGRFLFRGEDVQKPVAALSGGERSRLALCRLMLTQSNVLILDEPTNHLDLLSKEVLEDSLQDYEGTLIFVSHDRYFMDALATHILVLEPSGFTEYIGNYSDYLTKKADNEKWAQPGIGTGTSGTVGTTGAAWTRTGGTGAIAAGAATGTTGAGTSTPQVAVSPGRSIGATGATGITAATMSDGANSGVTGVSSGSSAQLPSERKVVRSADLRKQREKVSRLESEIADLETRLEETAAQLTTEGLHQDVARAQELELLLHKLTENHAERIAEWERAALELEELESAAER